MEAARLWAACRVLGEQASDDDIRALAANLDPYECNSEPIQWSRLAKRSGGYRFVCNLPPILKGKHYLISDLLGAALPDCAHLYDQKEKGTLVAISDIRNALEGGYDWCWYGDLRDCFQSVSAETLISRLPLPKAVVRKNLDHRQLTFETPASVDTPLFEGSQAGEDRRRHRPCGLLQGSPASNLALAMLFTDMADVFNLQECVPCVFADNIFVAAKTEATLNAVVSAVRAYLRAHPAGRFRLHKEGWVTPSETFTFLGCQFELADGNWQLSPHHAGLERMFAKLDGAEEEDCSRADGTIEATKRIVEGYRGAYHYWLEIDELMDGALTRASNFVTVATQAKQRQPRAQATNCGKSR